ncbi:MAG: HEAT repeat domain-containing protein [Proteobacteria bacterium]|nr:HEAT repeat domain-containing protein [Pseudomonadota bacterium]MBU4296124.1 HEAT repeat domain-containing protein [Pseudomonadota bacterium]MCG2746727.1 HEAT repeat domain-containing protein [Desulfobulbaceae bacterium]
MKCLVKSITTAVLLLLVFAGISAAKENPVISDLERIISQGQPATFAQFDAIKNNIEKNPREILPLLLAKANAPDLPDESLAVYIWALGMTREPEAVEAIIKLTQAKKNEMLQQNACRSLAMIGGDKSAEYLFRRLQQTSETMGRYYMFDLLAQLQYLPALPAAIEILQQDPKTFYWQSVFIFGKYGDAAVPFLLSKINDSNQNVRANAIMVLGQWLIAGEALAPLKKRFQVESDPKIRALILSSLERITSNVDDIRTFSEEILKTEKDEDVTQFAFETISNFEEMKKHIATFKASKKDDRPGFESAYKEIYDSLGKTGDYPLLAEASTRADEARLKKLKEVILQRNENDCFHDYQKINDVIMLNRLSKS